MATKRKPNESAETSGLRPRRLRLRTPPVGAKPLPSVKQSSLGEQYAFFLRARRVEIPASITGTPFYLKMGYTFKPGVPHPDGEGLNRLEKYR